MKNKSHEAEGQPMKRGRRKKFPSDEGRVTLAVTKDVHARLIAFCGDDFDLSATTNRMLSWIMDQPAGFKLAVMHRNRIEDDTHLRRAFCQVLQGFKDEVCGPLADGMGHGQTKGADIIEIDGGRLTEHQAGRLHPSRSR